MQDLKNKIALITGAGAGIGHAICKTLSDEGATVIAVARNKNNLEELQKSLTGNHHQFWTIDLSAEQGRQQLLQQLNSFGFPHIVVCNLSISPEKKRLINLTQQEFSKNFTVNIDHLFTIMQPTLQFQRAEKFGRWVGVSSLSAKTGLLGQSLYNAQKSVMESMLLNLAAEEGKYGITANCVAPGLIETPSSKQKIPKEVFDKIAAGNVVKRAGKPEEVAAAIGFFASTKASYITGITLPVCGGAQLAWQFL